MRKPINFKLIRSIIDKHSANIALGSTTRKINFYKFSGYLQNHIKSFLGGSSQFVHIPNHGKRKSKISKKWKSLCYC